MVSFQIASDLHIEYNNDEKVDPLTLISPNADILILAGDIGSLYKIEQLTHFIENITIYFKHTFFVPGNNEYYSQANYNFLSYKDLRKRLYELDSNIENFNVLDCACAQIDDICIAGATLWSNINVSLPKYIVRIPDMTTNMYTELFNYHTKYIENCIEYCKENNLKLICVTHHPPTEKTITKPRREKFKSLYYSDLDDLLQKDKVNTWICGHIHDNFNFTTENGTKLLSNQKGKPKDKITDYKDNFVFNI